MNGTGYDALRKVAAGEFTKDQRRRLEAFTAARGLLGSASRDEHVDWLLLTASFIVDGTLKLTRERVDL